MNEIKSRVIKSTYVNWKDLKILQPSNLKEFSDKSLEALKRSLLKKDFVCAFQVWDDGTDIWVLDGTHRLKVLEVLEAEGHKVPDKFIANFIDCKDRKEACELVLVFSSRYAEITQKGLEKYLEDEALTLDWDILDLDVNITKEAVLNDDEKGLVGVKTKLFDDDNVCCPFCNSMNVAKVKKTKPKKPKDDDG